MTMLTCDNLIFRRPKLEDADALFHLKNNENAAYLLGGVYHPYSMDDIARWINYHNNNPEEVLLVIEDTIVGKLIGHIGLYKIDQIAKKTEIWIIIADDDSRGKGYGTKSIKLLIGYAFNTLGMHKVTAEVLSENVPSIAVFKKCGFSVDGCLRDDVYKNDRYYDVLSMSILIDDFKSC